MARLRCHLQRLRTEAGFAVPTVLLALVAAFGLGSAAVVASVNSQQGSVRDQNTKAALAAAEAGVADALVRFNRMPPESDASVCEPVGNPSVPAGQWCPVEMTGDIDRGGFSYWVRPSSSELEIVSTGSIDGVARRIDVQAHSAPGSPFGEYSVIGLDHVTQESGSTITANVGTNGDISLDSNASLHCNDAQVGEGRDAPGIDCYPPDEGFLKLAPVNQGDVATNNDNNRITLAKAGEPGGDTISGNRNRVDWDPETRMLRLRQNTSLTLGGSNYSLCRLVLESNTNLFIVAGAQVRIYFDAPEACPPLEDDYQLMMSSNSSIDATGSGPGDLALLFVGSESQTTRIMLASNSQADGPCEHSFVVYAPRTEIDLASNSHICGAIAGKSINVASNATVSTSSLASDFDLPNTPPHYSTEHPGTFVECAAAAPAPPAPPNTGC